MKPAGSKCCSLLPNKSSGNSNACLTLGNNPVGRRAPTLPDLRSVCGHGPPHIPSSKSQIALNQTWDVLNALLQSMLNTLRTSEKQYSTPGDKPHAFMVPSPCC